MGEDPSAVHILPVGDSVTGAALGDGKELKLGCLAKPAAAASTEDTFNICWSHFQNTHNFSASARFKVHFYTYDILTLNMKHSKVASAVRSTTAAPHIYAAAKQTSYARKGM